MATYKVYPAVRKAQAYFEAQKDAGAISYATSLKEADGSFDGKWGDDTQEAMWAYLSVQPEGTDLRDLIGKGVLTSAELATITTAISEYNVIKGSGGSGGGGGSGDPATPPPTDLTPAKVPLWKWIMGGTLVATGGVVVYMLVKSQSKKSRPALRPAHARGHAGLAGLGRTKKPKSIVIIGRRWFNRGPGNTYHSAQIIVDGKQVEGIDFAYGYGEQYAYNAMGKLSKLGLISGWDNQHNSPWRWAEDNGVALTYSVSDVQRKKDL